MFFRGIIASVLACLIILCLIILASVRARGQLKRGAHSDKRRDAASPLFPVLRRTRRNKQSKHTHGVKKRRNRTASTVDHRTHPLRLRRTRLAALRNRHVLELRRRTQSLRRRLARGRRREMTKENEKRERTKESKEKEDTSSAHAARA